METVLLLEDAPLADDDFGECACGEVVAEVAETKGGLGKMSKCVSWQTVYSPALGKEVRRCAKFAKFAGAGGLGQLVPSMDDITDTLKTGAIAAGGAIVSNLLINQVAKVVDLKGTTKNLAQMVSGILIGMIGYRVTQDEKLSAALGLGPVVVGALGLIGQVLAPLGGQGLGLVAIEEQRTKLALPQSSTISDGAQSLGLYATEPSLSKRIPEISMSGSPWSF